MLKTAGMFFSKKGEDLLMASRLEENCTPMRTLAGCAEEKQVKVFLNLCELVRFVREHGILAFEISPDVVHYSTKEEVTIEFKGLNRFPDASYLTWATRWGFPYAPPEAWDPGIGKEWPERVASEKAAVWALGATMYEISSPFCHDLKQYIDSKVHECDVLIRPEVSPALIFTIESAMAPSKSKRPSLTELTRRLAAIESGEVPSTVGGIFDLFSLFGPHHSSHSDPPETTPELVDSTRGESTMPSISFGSVLGGYLLHTIIGRGGVGFVFKASYEGHHNYRGQTSAHFAIKVASPKIDEAACLRKLKNAKIQFNYDAKGLYFLTGGYICTSVGWDHIPEVLWQEYSTLKNINSDLFPKVFEFSAKDDACYYVMEYIDGRDFRSVLANESPNNCIHWIERLRELIVSLSSIKKKHFGFYHGDIKPENIIVDRTGRMRVIDPALTRETPFGLGGTFTVPYNPLGLKGVEADTFAVATIIIEILLGRVPFANLTAPFISMQRPYQPYEIEKHLKFNDLKEALPSSIDDMLVDWLRQPRSYAKMLNEWRFLDPLARDFRSRF